MKLDFKAAEALPVFGQLFIYFIGIIFFKNFAPLIKHDFAVWLDLRSMIILKNKPHLISLFLVICFSDLIICFFWLISTGPKDLVIIWDHWKDGGGLGGMHHLHLQRHWPGEPELHVHGGRNPRHSQGTCTSVPHIIYLTNWSHDVISLNSFIAGGWLDCSCLHCSIKERLFFCLNLGWKDVSVWSSSCGMLSSFSHSPKTFMLGKLGILNEV